MEKMSEEIVLNYHTYPLVVGNADKYTFSNWDMCGSTVLIEPKIIGENYTNNDIKWEVFDESVAEVKNGLVRAKTTGFTTVRASLPSGAAACCEIAVIDNITRTTTLWLELSTDQMILESGECADILAFLYPEDVLKNGAMNRNVLFESSDRAVAEVERSGKLIAASEGTAEIRVVSEDIGREAVCKIQVISRANTEYCDIREIVLNEVRWPNRKLPCCDSSHELTVGCSACMGIRTKGDVGGVIWRSSNPYIASVNEHGKVISHSAGEVTIYATTIRGGKRKEFHLSVKPVEINADKIILSKQAIRMSAGEQQTVYGLALPAAFSSPHFQWELSDSEIAEIVSIKENEFGGEEVVVQAMKEGSAFIKASYKEITAVCTVHIGSKGNVGNLCVEPEKRLQIEEVYRLKYTYDDGDFNHELHWLSDDRECVSVNPEGTVKAYAPGRVRIFCISGDNLTTEERYQLWKLSQVRRLEQDSYWSAKLQTILNHAVYGESEIIIEAETDGQHCLRNLHIVDEAVTADSVMLLWNRASLPDTDDFSHYLVTWKKRGEGYCDENKALTVKLGYTANELEPETDYEFCVAALDGVNRVIRSQTVHARTSKSSKVIDVTTKPYFAAGSGKTIDTYAIQKAIDDCPENGTVLLPAGHVFYSGALFLKSNMIFEVEGILIGSTDPKDYPPVVTRWEGWRKLTQPAKCWVNSTDAVPENRMAYASLLNAGVYDEGERGKSGPYHVENVIIRGHGMINGNGFKLGYNEGPNHYDIDGGLPVPFSTRMDPSIRGRAITIHNGKNIYIKDVTVCYSPSWTIHTIYCSHVTMDHIMVISKGTGKTGASDDICILNGDGIDPDSSIHVNIFDCFFYTGDDAVAVKSGRDREGNELNKPSAYIRVTDCASVGSKGGFCIGSEQAAGAHDILWQNLVVKDIDLFGLWIKASPSRGGLVQDIMWKDCVLEGTQGGIFLEDRYHGSGSNPARVLPEICHNTFQNICSKRQKYFGIKVAGLEDSYIHDILIRDSLFEEILSDEDEAFEVICGQNIVIENTEIPKGYSWNIDEVSVVLNDQK